MRYGSVSSGIECAAMAWAPLGWHPAFLAEIDPFACTVLHHHHSSGRPRHMPSPDAEGIGPKERKKRAAAIKAVQCLPEHANGVPNHGDMTTFEDWPDADIDILIGGTPCQSWSVAGLRQGLDDPRGDLTLTYAAIARRFRPRWLVWENVAGVLSHDRGRSFASLLGLLSGRRVEAPKGGWQSAGIVEGYGGAYGLAWRVLDTQYVRVDGFGRAIPQRRRRVFVVGHSGGEWHRAAAVLFEREGMSGSAAPRRGPTQDLTGTLAGGARSRGGYSHDDIPFVEEAFGGNRQSGSIPTGRLDFESETFVTTVAPTLDASFGRLQGQSGQDASHGHSHLVAHTLLAKGNDSRAADLETYVATRDVAATLTRGADSAGSGGYAGRRQEDDTNLVSYALRADASRSGEAKTPSLDSEGNARLRNAGFNFCEEFAPTLDTSNPPTVSRGWAVRRLTPRECCRLQGVPEDHFANVVWRGKSPPPDGPIYKTLGNGFSVNVVRWIGRRIEMVERIFAQGGAK